MAMKPKQPKFCWDCEHFNRNTDYCGKFGAIVPEAAQHTPDMCPEWEEIIDEIPF